MASAYLDKANKRIIIVAINVSSTAKVLSFNFKNFAVVDTITHYITSNQAGYNLRKGNEFLSNSQFNMPAKSIVTFVKTMGNDTRVEYKTDSDISASSINNYPNPFNSNTNISYTLKNDGRVVIELFDLLGRKIDTILDDVKPAGNYLLNYSPQILASGIYLIKINSNRTNQLKKIIYLK